MIIRLFFFATNSESSPLCKRTGTFARFTDAQKKLGDCPRVFVEQVGNRDFVWLARGQRRFRCFGFSHDNETSLSVNLSLPQRDPWLREALEVSESLPTSP